MKKQAQDWIDEVEKEEQEKLKKIEAKAIELLEEEVIEKLKKNGELK